MPKDFETFAADAMGKHPDSRSQLEHQIVKQLVGGREDVARALYSSSGGDNVVPGNLTINKKGGRVKVRLDRKGKRRLSK